MKNKNFITLGLSCLLCFGAISLASCGETKYKVNIDCPSDATVSGLNAEQKYAKDEVVSFTVAVNSGSIYSIDTVKVQDTTLTAQNNVYSFGMLAQDVTIHVALKDAREVAFTLEANTVEVDESIGYTITFGGQEPTEYAITFQPSDAISVDQTGKKIHGLKACEDVTVTALVGNKTAVQHLAVTNNKVSLQQAYADALTTSAKNKGNFSGKAYQVKSLVVAKGNLSNGYGDAIIYDGTSFADCNSLNSTTYGSVEVGDKVITKGEITNYFGMLEFKYNSKGTVKTMEFVKKDNDITAPSPEDFDAAKYDAYYTKAEDASTASQSTAGNTINDIIEVKYIKCLVTTKDFEKSGDVDAYRGLQLGNSTHGLNFDITPDSLEGKQVLNTAAEGVEFNIEGYILGANTSKNRANVLLSKVELKEYTVNSVGLTSDKTALAYGEVAQLTATVDPVQAVKQYGVNYVADKPEAVEISADGKVTPKIIAEDTDVKIKAVCNGKQSDEVTINVKASVEGDVVFTDKISEIQCDFSHTFKAMIVGHTSDAVTYSSSVATVGTIDATTGEFLAVGVGETVVTATSSLDPTKSSSVTVSVIARTDPLHAGTEADPYTVDDVKLVCKDVASENWLKDEEGNVRIVYATGFANDSAINPAKGGFNFDLTDKLGDSSKVVVYACTPAGETTDVIAGGDTVVVKGSIENYKGTIEFTGMYSETSPIDYPSATSITHHEYDITAPTLEHGTFAFTSGVTEGKVTSGSNVTFTVTPDTNYKIASVSVNGESLTADDGVYTFVASNKANFLISIIDKDAVVAKAYYAGSSNANMTGSGNNAEKVNLDANVFNVTAALNSGTSTYCGLNKAGYIALYCNKNTATGGSVKFELPTGGTLISVTVSFKQNAQYAKVTDADGKVLTGTGDQTIVYAPNSRSIQIQDVANQSSATQVHMYWIEFVYKLAA